MTDYFLSTGQDWSSTREKIFSSNVSQYMFTELIPKTFYEIRLIRIGNDNCPQLISPAVNFTTLGNNKWVWSQFVFKCWF